jgi:hypothetical protein
MKNQSRGNLKGFESLKTLSNFKEVENFKELGSLKDLGKALGQNMSGKWVHSGQVSATGILEEKICAEQWATCGWNAFLKAAAGMPSESDSEKPSESVFISPSEYLSLAFKGTNRFPPAWNVLLPEDEKKERKAFCAKLRSALIPLIAIERNRLLPALNRLETATSDASPEIWLDAWEAWNSALRGKGGSDSKSPTEATGDIHRLKDLGRLFGKLK